MSNPFVLGGYAAAAGILGLYVVYVRHRARVLTRALAARDPAGVEDAP